jgi:hypothetical protein
VVLLAARLPVREHTRPVMYRRQQILLAHLQVREHTRLTIPALELILAHTQTHLRVLEHIRATIQVAEHIPVHILAHMRVIQFKKLKIQYQQYLSGFAPLKLYYILYIISFYGELNDCG